MKQRKLLQMRRAHLLAVIVGCKQFNLKPTLNALTDALLEVEGDRDPLCGRTTKERAELQSSVLFYLSVLELHGLVQREREHYYEATAAGIKAAALITVPVRLMSVPFLTALQMRGAQYYSQPRAA